MKHATIIIYAMVLSNTTTFSLAAFIAFLLCVISTHSREAMAFSLAPQKPAGLSQEAILTMARKRYSHPATTKKNNENELFPMKGKVAVITGAAGGIGGELCKVIHSLGGIVVALDRNGDGLDELVQKCLISSTCMEKDDDDEGIPKRTSESGRDRIDTMVVNQEDFNSVSNVANIIQAKYPKIDVLVNNAGLSYPQDGTAVPGDARMISAQGKDLAFTVNYLSHCLLTEKLLDCLSNSDNDNDGGRIVHLTSTFHWKVDGSELLIDNDDNDDTDGDGDGDPIAYQSDAKMQSPKHVQRSYANTKLAQIWHSRSIQKFASTKSKKYKRVSSVCACPTWAATGIAGESGRDFLSKYAFPVENCGPGVTSAINAILRTDEELGDALNNGMSFVANSKIVEFLLGDRWLTSDLITNKLKCRDSLTDMLAGVLLIGQRITYDDFIIQRTSPESFNDEEKRDQFYQWSMRAVEEWI